MGAADPVGASTMASKRGFAAMNGEDESSGLHSDAKGADANKRRFVDGNEMNNAHRIQTQSQSQQFQQKLEQKAVVSTTNRGARASGVSAITAAVNAVAAAYTANKLNANRINEENSNKDFKSIPPKVSSEAERLHGEDQRLANSAVDSNGKSEPGVNESRKNDDQGTAGVKADVTMPAPHINNVQIKGEENGVKDKTKQPPDGKGVLWPMKQVVRGAYAQREEFLLGMECSGEVEFQGIRNDGRLDTLKMYVFVTRMR